MPVGEKIRDVVGPTEVVNDPVLLSFQDHGRACQPLNRAEDVTRPSLVEAQLGERLVDAFGLAELGKLLVDNVLAHGLGDGRELDLMRQ